MKFRAALQNLVLTAMALAIAGPARAIVGADRDAAPFADAVVAVLTRGPQGSGYCTAAVLGPDLLLTAAHCLRPPADMLAMTRDADGQTAFLPVLTTRAHPGYRADAIRRREISIDVAVIRLARPLPAHYRPVALAVDAPPPPGEAVTAVGFGLAREGEPHSGGVLRAVGLEVGEPRSAVLLWAKGAPGAGACSGDSGGPIFNARGEVTALVAWTRGAAGRLCGALTQGPWLAPLRRWIDQD